MLFSSSYTKPQLLIDAENANLISFLKLYYMFKVMHFENPNSETIKNILNNAKYRVHEYTTPCFASLL